MRTDHPHLTVHQTLPQVLAVHREVVLILRQAFLGGLVLAENARRVEEAVDKVGANPGARLFVKVCGEDGGKDGGHGVGERVEVGLAGEGRRRGNWLRYRLVMTYLLEKVT
jgi:hypothetical protein